MAVTLSKRVYNPAAALGSRGCCSAGTRRCQHPDARVPCTLRYPWEDAHIPMERGMEQEQRLFLCLRCGTWRDRCPHHPPASCCVTQPTEGLND